MTKINGNPKSPISTPISKDKAKSTYKELKDRCNSIKKWILNRPEKNICIVAHCSFLLAFMNDNITKEQIEDICETGIKHCIPYKMLLQ